MTARIQTRALSWMLWGATALVMTLPWLLQPHTEAPVLWWAGRALGFMAYIALWLAMLTGLLISSPGLLRRLDCKVVLELHQQWTFAGAVATVLHVLAITTHGASGIDLLSALVPYASTRLTGPVALGTLAFWGVVLVCATSWLRSHMSYNAWRIVHTVAFGAFLLALTHAVTVGTDSGYLLVRWLYGSSSVVLLAAMALRIGVSFTKRRRSGPATARPAHERSGLAAATAQPEAPHRSEKLAA